MGIYKVSANNPSAAEDINQYVRLLAGGGPNPSMNGGPYADVVVANRIRAQAPGAVATSGFVGGTTGYSVPTTGTYATGDWCTVQDSGLAICTSGGTPGTWRFFGSWQYSDNATQSNGGVNQQLVQRTGRSGFDVILFNASLSNMPYFSPAQFAYTIPFTGWWLINLNVEFGPIAGSTADQTIMILRDGNVAAMGPQFQMGNFGNAAFGTVLRFNAGDTLQAGAYSEDSQGSVFWGLMSMGLCLVAA